MLKRFCQKIDDFESPNLVFGIFLFFWFVVNILQASFTELAHDEAYYWMYSRYLDWGYFDHPPMIAFLVKIGYTLFKNELGVRLFPLLIGTSTVFIVYLLIKDELKSLSLFLIMLCSVLIFQSHIGGFLAIPDMPVVFFAALFFLVYKKYLVSNSTKQSLLLGFIAAAMLFSKYHGFLVLFFTLLSNLSLLKRRNFWLIPLSTVVLLIPHLLWQYNNNFPSIEYHLFARSSAYKFDHTFNYIYSQLLISGPFIGIILFYHAWKFKNKGNAFSKALRFNFIGFIVFFFLSSFKGHVEAHWTAIAYIPALILSYNSIKNSDSAQKWIRILFLPSFVLFLFIRMCLVFEILPSGWKVGAEFHNWDKWAHQIKNASNGSKVVFVNSFQRPSKYAFYTGGDFAHTLNTIYYRKNQYDVWNFEDSIQSKPVFLVGSINPADSLATVKDTYPIEFFDTFYSYYGVKIAPSITKAVIKAGENVRLSLKIENPSSDTLFFKHAKEIIPVQLVVTIHAGKTFYPTQFIRFVPDPIPPGSFKLINIKIPSPKKDGYYYYYFSIVNDYLISASTSAVVKLKVVK